MSRVLISTRAGLYGWVYSYLSKGWEGGLQSVGQVQEKRKGEAEQTDGKVNSDQETKNPMYQGDQSGDTTYYSSCPKITTEKWGGWKP